MLSQKLDLGNFPVRERRSICKAKLQSVHLEEVLGILAILVGLVDVKQVSPDD